MSSYLYHSTLNAHKGIGVDIDATLINGPASFKLQQWCEAYHQEIELHLITFRDGRDFDLIGDDLFASNVKMEWFKGVHGIPTEISKPFWDLANKVGIRGRMHEPKWQRALAHHKSSVEAYNELELELAMWKGTKCKELGLTALIDDLETLVVPGCKAHGVEFIDSLKLFTV